MTAPAATTNDRVVRIIVQHFGQAATDIGARLAEDLGADSLDLVELTMEMEEEFSIGISDDECEACATVADWQKLIAAKLGEGA